MKLLDRRMILARNATCALSRPIPCADAARAPVRPSGRSRAGIVPRAQHKAKRSERRRIEAHAGVEVANAQSDVVVHEFLQLKRAKPRGLEKA